jgi:ornithine cyclodeaminase/alanine dehydrogenase-like protein (mu-crystallin family)
MTRIVNLDEIRKILSGMDQITIADLTGVAVQDVQIAKSVYRKLTERDQE